jgi:hypothetical protein
MAIDLNKPFAVFAFEYFAEYRKTLPHGTILDRKNWIEQMERAHKAWTDFHAPKRPSQAKAPSTDAEAIYLLYPKKVGRKDALQAIAKALAKASADRLRERVSTYASVVARYRHEDRAFVPNPATWFNQERWLDDPSAWERPNMAPVANDKRPAPSLPEPAGFADWFRRTRPDALYRPWGELDHVAKRYLAGEMAKEKDSP